LTLELFCLFWCKCFDLVFNMKIDLQSEVLLLNRFSLL
jgi:hypothetical protein